MPFIHSTTGQELLSTEIAYFGRRCLVVCDRKCNKAWGFSHRPELRDKLDPDDVVWFDDSEVGAAPDDSHTYEGGQGKPNQPERHNKWCVRECERSNTIDVGQPIRCNDWSHRIYNQPKKHGLTDNPQLETNQSFK
jgi:hypothetical protein